MVKRNEEGIIEFICEGGIGSEARVLVELRTKFPGIGGTIITQEGAVTALREEYNLSPKSGHKMFLRHMIIKKLEDYFYRKHVYNLAHIPRPLGSISRVGDDSYEAYLYEWAFGNESFSWRETDREGNPKSVKLRDWNKFADHFYQIGVDMGMDITDPDDGRISKNIIHQLSTGIDIDTLEMNSLWKRIDFGYRSVPMDYEKLSNFLKENKNDLISVLRIERCEMLELAIEYLSKGKNKMKEIDIGRLDVLIGDYRRKTLDHYTSRGSGLTDKLPYFGKRTESLT